jgi:hypothetical protein
MRRKIREPVFNGLLASGSYGWSSGLAQPRNSGKLDFRACGGECSAEHLELMPSGWWDLRQAHRQRAPNNVERSLWGQRQVFAKQRGYAQRIAIKPSQRSDHVAIIVCLVVTSEGHEGRSNCRIWASTTCADVVNGEAEGKLGLVATMLAERSHQGQVAVQVLASKSRLEAWLTYRR